MNIWTLVSRLCQGHNFICLVLGGDTPKQCRSSKTFISQHLINYKCSTTNENIYFMKKILNSDVNIFRTPHAEIHTDIVQIFIEQPIVILRYVRNTLDEIVGVRKSPWNKRYARNCLFQHDNFFRFFSHTDQIVPSFLSTRMINLIQSNL